MRQASGQADRERGDQEQAEEVREDREDQLRRREHVVDEVLIWRAGDGPERSTEPDGEVEEEGGPGDPQRRARPRGERGTQDGDAVERGQDAARGPGHVHQRGGEEEVPRQLCGRDPRGDARGASRDGDGEDRRRRVGRDDERDQE